MENVKFSYGWHIYRDNSVDADPLCWDGAALEFASEEEAWDFLETMITNSYEDKALYQDLVVKQDVLAYPDFKDARNKILYYTEDGEETLV